MKGMQIGWVVLSQAKLMVSFVVTVLLIYIVF